ncbi:MAG TPA: DUF5709 domain-containing protein [Jatrophihabitans sp.]
MTGGGTAGEEGFDVDPVDPIDGLTGDDPDEAMQTGYSPPEREPRLLRDWPTEAEERAGPSLDERLAEEAPEDTGAWDEADPRAGRLVDPDEGGPNDTEAEQIAEDVGPAGYASSAEEAAMHIRPEDRT